MFLLAPRPTPTLDDHLPLSFVHSCLFGLFTATLSSWRPLSIHNPRTCHGVVTWDLSNIVLELLNYFYIAVLFKETVGVSGCITLNDRMIMNWKEEVVVTQQQEVRSSHLPRGIKKWS
jgi:hypothetical protein